MATSRTKISAREFRSALQKVSTEIVWKNAYLAAQGESSIYASSIDSYLMYARQLKKYFSTATLNAIFSYSTKEFNEWIEFYHQDGMSEAERSKVIAAIRFMNPNSGTTHYVEHNDYYRMLMGLPSESTPSANWVYPDQLYNDLDGKYFEYENAVQLADEDSPRTIIDFDNSFNRTRRIFTAKFNSLVKFKSLAYIDKVTLKFNSDVSDRLKIILLTSDGNFRQEYEAKTLVGPYIGNAPSQVFTFPIHIEVQGTKEAPVGFSINFEGMNTIDATVEVSYIDNDHVYQIGNYYYDYKGLFENSVVTMGSEDFGAQGVYYSTSFVENLNAIRDAMKTSFPTWLPQHPVFNQKIRLDPSSTLTDVIVYYGGTLEEVRDAVLHCIQQVTGMDLITNNQYTGFMTIRVEPGSGDIRFTLKHNEFIVNEFTPSIAGSEARLVGAVPVVRGDYKYDDYGKAIRIPVHLWDSFDIIRWENTDDYQNFIAEHSSDEYQYLKHMTTKKIYPYIAREAKPFDIMYCPNSDPESLATDFKECYSLSRDMFVDVWYTDAMRNREGRYYESFSAMAILFMALNQMNYRYLDADIDRDFYDLDSLKIIYEAYSVPFYENIPLQYHKRVVKNINRLIRWKGSNKVFYELCDLFDYDILGIYQYYLMKERQYDVNGNPIVAQTQAVDDAGQPLWEVYQCIHAYYDLPTYPNSKTRVEGPYVIPQGSELEILDSTSTRYKVRVPRDGKEREAGPEVWIIKDDELLRVDTIKHTKLAILANTYTYENPDDIPTAYTGWILTPGAYYDLRTNDDGSIIKEEDRVYGGDVVSIVRHTTNPMYDGRIYWIRLGQNTAALMDVEWPTDNDGHRIPVMTEDAQAMYDVKFMKANIEENPFNNLSDIDNIITYASVTDPDSYWFHDSDTIRTMYQNEYNFIETKYIGVQLTFELAKVMYESCYFMKMLHDNGAEFNDAASKHLVVSNDRMGVEVTLYDFVLYIFAAICKKNGYPGIIPTNPEGIARVYGFNYKGIFAKLRESSLRGFHIQKDYKTESGSYVYDFYEGDYEVGNNMSHGADIQDWMSLESYLRASKDGEALYARVIEALHNLEPNPMNNDSIRKAYNAMMDLKEQIEYHLIACSDRLEFQAWSMLHRIMYTTEEINEVWTKEDGEIAESFMDLLEDANPALWSRLDNMDSQELITEINYCLVQLEKLCQELKYIEYIDGIDIDIITEYLYSLLRYFKSAKVDLVDFDLVFKISGRTENFFKLFADFNSMDYTTWVDVDFQRLHDLINTIWFTTELPDREFVFNFHDHIAEYYLKMYPYGDDPNNSLVEKFHTYIPDMCKEVDDWDDLLPVEVPDVDSVKYEPLPHDSDNVDSSKYEPLPHDTDNVQTKILFFPGCYFGIDALHAPHEGAFYGRACFNPDTKTRAQEVYFLDNYGNYAHATELWYRYYDYEAVDWGPWVQQPFDEEISGKLLDRQIMASVSADLFQTFVLHDDPEFLDAFTSQPHGKPRLQMTYDKMEEVFRINDDLRLLSTNSNIEGEGEVENTPNGLKNQVYYFTGLADPEDQSWGLYDTNFTVNLDECQTKEIEGLNALFIPLDDVPTYADDQQQWVAYDGDYMSGSMNTIMEQLKFYKGHKSKVRCIAIVEGGIIIFDDEMLASGQDPIEYYREKWADNAPSIYYVSTHSFALQNSEITDNEYITNVLDVDFGIQIANADKIGVDPTQQARMYQKPGKRWFIAQITTFDHHNPKLMDATDHLILDMSSYAPLLHGDELSIDMADMKGFYHTQNTFISFNGSEYWHHPDDDPHATNLYCTQIRNDDDQYKADLTRFISASLFKYHPNCQPSELENNEFTYDIDTLMVTVRNDEGLSIWEWQGALAYLSANRQGFSIVWKAEQSFYEDIDYTNFKGLVHLPTIELNGFRTVTSSNCVVETGTLRAE